MATPARQIEGPIEGLLYFLKSKCRGLKVFPSDQNFFKKHIFGGKTVKGLLQNIFHILHKHKGSVPLSISMQITLVHESTSTEIEVMKLSLH